MRPMLEKLVFGMAGLYLQMLVRLFMLMAGSLMLRLGLDLPNYEVNLL